MWHLRILAKTGLLDYSRLWGLCAMLTYSFNLLAGPLYSFTKDSNNNKRAHSGLQNKPGFEALDQVFIKILPWGMRGHLSHYVKNRRVFESFRKNRRAFQSFAVEIKGFLMLRPSPQHVPVRSSPLDSFLGYIHMKSSNQYQESR